LNDEIKKETKLKKQYQSALSFQTRNLESLDWKHHAWKNHEANLEPIKYWRIKLGKKINYTKGFKIKNSN
jgi:hypothetical protein